MPMAKYGIILGAAVAVVAGCAAGTSGEAIDQEVTLAVQQEVSDPGELWAAAMNSEGVEAGWIESFDAPTLTALVIEAQENNRSLASAAANFDRALALARRAGAAQKPDVNAGVSGSTAGTAGSSVTAETLTIGATVSWEVDVWGRLRSGQRAAIASAQAIEADLRSARESLAAAAARAYFTAIEAGLLAGISTDAVDILDQTLRIVTIRYEIGVASAQDVSLTKSDLATAREQLATIEGSRRDAIRALEVILGRYPGAELGISEALPQAPPSPPAGLPSQLLERRPDVVAAERRVASAFNATAQAQAALLPSITLTAEAGGASTSLASVADPSNAVWSLGANLLAPIFDGGTRRENVEIATAEQEQALANYGQVALNAFLEVETNLDQGFVIARRIADLKVAVSEAENAFRIAKLSYQEGEEDLLSVLTVQRRVNTARSSLSRAQRLLLEQRVNLNLALGGGWEA